MTIDAANHPAIVRPYAELTFSGKLRRLHVLAAEALTRYDLDRPRLAYLCWHTNLLYQVTTASGERFVLRLAAPGWRTLDDLQAEAMWLTALARDTTIQSPRVLPARSGELVLPMSSPGTGPVRNTTLLSLVPGRLLGHYLTEPNLAKMGELFAELHIHGSAWKPPAGFTARRFEHWQSRGEENLLTGDRAAQLPAGAGVPVTLPSNQRELLGRIEQRVEDAYAAINRSDLRVIHCDLWHDNITIHHGVLHPFDFEDTVWGFRAHDIAMAMLDLLETVGEARYPGLLAAFRRGYEGLLPWPADPIESFQIGRLLWKVNWFARRRPERLLAEVERHEPVFRHFEQTGLVRAPANS